MMSTEERVGSSASLTAPVSPSGDDNLDFTLSNITVVLRPLEDKYDSLGKHLGVKPEDLKRIEGNYPNNNERRFSETIDFWWKNCHNRSYSVLADAVDKVGGHGRLVRKLRAFESSSSEDAGYSTKVSDSPSRYSSGSDIEYFDEAPGCNCDKPCSVYTISSGRCPTPTNTKVGIVRKRIENQATRGALLPEETIDSEEEDYTERFEKETKQIRVRFAELVDSVSVSFKKRNVTTHRAVLFLQNTHPVLKSRIDEMTKATDMDQVLTIVTGQACSWFNYEIIKDLVDKFGDDNDRKQLSEYEAKFKEFAEQRKLPKGKKHIEIGSGARQGGKQLVIKIDKEWNEVNFNDLDIIRNNLASILNVKRRDLYLADVREGCVMVTFMITEEMAETLFPKKNNLTSSKLSSYFSSSQLKLLQDEGIILLTCGKVSWRWRPAMDQSLPEPQEKSLVYYSKPLDSHPDSLLDRKKLESQSLILGSPKERSTEMEIKEWTEASTILPPPFIGLSRRALLGQRSWRGSNKIYPPPVPPSGSQLSQDSVFNSLTSLPPLPPRPEESDSNDPTYFNIDEIMVRGPESQRWRSSSGVSGARGRVSSLTIDDIRKELEKIMEFMESLMESQSPIHSLPKEIKQRSMEVDEQVDIIRKASLRRGPPMDVGIIFIAREEWTEAIWPPLPALIGSDMLALPDQRSWGSSNKIYPPPVSQSGSQLSQDSIFNSLTWPPPLPPRPEESDSNDPDYFYIDETMVKGPESQRWRSSSGVSGARGCVNSLTIDDLPKELEKAARYRIERLGFNREEVHDYFHEYLGDDSEAEKTLFEKIEEKPEISGTGYLSLDASILIHLYKSATKQSPVVTADGSGAQPLDTTFIESLREELTESIWIPNQLPLAFIGSDMSSRRPIKALPGQRLWGSSNKIYPPPVPPSGSQLSQDSIFNSLTYICTLLPPLPPRPKKSDSNDHDCSYMYIDEIMVRGPESQCGRSNSGVSGARGCVNSLTLFSQLKKKIMELEEKLKMLHDEEFNSIMKLDKELKKWHDKELKKNTMKCDKVANQTGRKADTLYYPSRSSSRSRLPMNFARAEPEDYMVLCKRLTSTSLEGVSKRDKVSPNIDNLPQSLTDHFGNTNNSSSSSIETAPGEVLDNSQLPPDAHNNSSSIGNISSVNSGAVGGVVEPGGDPPALPPWLRRKDSMTRIIFISSATSSVPPFTNPPPAAGLSQKSSSADILKEFIPDLVTCTAICNYMYVSDLCLSKGLISDSTHERVLESRGMSKEDARILVLSVQSSVSSNTSSIYQYPRRFHSLISMNEEGERRSLSSYLQDLENKVNRQSSYTCNLPPNSGSLNQLKNSNQSAAAIANEQARVAVQTDFDAATRQTELVQADLSWRPVASADAHPLPLLKHNTISSSLVSSPTMNNVASTKSPSASSVFSPVMNNAPPLKVDGTMGGAPPVLPGNLVSPGDEAQLPPQPLPLASRMQQPPCLCYHPCKKNRSLYQTNTSSHPDPRGLSTLNSLGSWKTTDCIMPPSAGGMAPGVGGPPPGAAFHNQNHIDSRTTDFAHHLNRNGGSR